MVSVMRGSVICVVWLALATGGCGGDVTIAGQGHAPRTASEQEAANVVRAYDQAIRRSDSASVCLIVGGTELDAFRCRSRPSIPTDRRSWLSDPAELRVEGNDSREGWIFLSGSASGGGSHMGLLFKVSRARAALRVTRVDAGRTL
jgi:hypothetical protein